MQAAETTARECGKTLAVLDAVTDGDAARLYERLGWVRVGAIPGYALLPRGGLVATTVYYATSVASSSTPMPRTFRVQVKRGKLHAALDAKPCGALRGRRSLTVRR